MSLRDALAGLAEPTAKGESFANTIEHTNAENGQALARPRGAIEQPAEAGIDVPPPPVGKTYEEKVYSVLLDFRDTMLKMPSDPKKVARVTEPTPLEAVATVDDLGELIEWLRQFHEELVRVAEWERRRREDRA